jgi:hypothetical protein
MPDPFPPSASYEIEKLRNEWFIGGGLSIKF